MQIEQSNEIDLIRQTLAGNTSAFDQLVKTHRRTVYVLVLSYTKNPEDADDLTQRIFMRAYERLSTLRDLNRFLPWLQQIAHNACKDWLRCRSDSAWDFEAVNNADFTGTAPSPEELALKREIEGVVREAISALKETDRKLMEGRYIDGASYDQLQTESGLSYPAIANRLKRAKQQLRRRIEKLLGGLAVLPGRTLISGGIETVKLSAKTKLVSIGMVALIGIGGGVWYHQTFDSNPIIVNEQRDSGTEAVTEDRSSDQPAPHDAVTKIDIFDDASTKVFSDSASDDTDVFTHTVNDFFENEQLSPEVGNVQADDFNTDVEAEAEAAYAAQQIAELGIKISQALQERRDLLDMIEELAPFSRKEAELYELRQQLQQEAHDMRKTIFSMSADYIQYTGDITDFQPGGEFHALMRQNHIGIQRAVR